MPVDATLPYDDQNIFAKILRALMDPRIERLEAVIKARKGADPSSSYVASLFAKGTAKIAQGFEKLRLTESGLAFEAQLFETLRTGLSAAYAAAGQESVTGFWRVLEGLIPEGEKPMVMKLQGRGR